MPRPSELRSRKSSPRDVAVHAIRTAVAYAQQHGLSVDEILSEAGFARDIVAQAHTQVPAEQVTAMVRYMWRACDDELLGPGPHRVTRCTFKLVTLAVINAPDLRTALRRFGELAPAMSGLPPICVILAGGVGRVEIDTAALDDPGHLIIESMLSALHHTVGWLIGSNVRLRSVELPYRAPHNPEEYPLIFGCAPTFSAPVAALTFLSEALDAPIVRDENELLDFIRNSSAQAPVLRDCGRTTDQVRSVLEHGLIGDWPSSEEVASRLSLSLQHVRRLLREEGTSVRQIRENILRDAAIASLLRGQESIPELSARLGFSEPSAFRRAFRRWTGSPPGAYRPCGDDTT